MSARVPGRPVRAGRLRSRRPLPVRLFVAIADVLLPEDFRCDCARQLGETFEDLYSEARRVSLAATARFLGREFYHLIRTALKERARLRRVRRQQAAAATANRHTQASSMDSLIQDLRYGLKALSKRPGITLVAALSLGIGIGVNAAIFAAVDLFLFRPLPFPEAERLVQLWTTNTERGWTEVSFSLPDALDYRARSGSVDVAVYRSSEVNLAGDGEPERLSGLRASANFFRVVGFGPAAGRGFLPEEESAGADRVAVISRGLWQRRFGGGAGVVGREIELNGIRHTVVGVMTEALPDPFRDFSVFLPLGITGEEERFSRSFSALGRLQSGTTLEGSRAELESIAASLAEAYPDANGNNGINVIGLREELFSEDDRQATLIVSVAVAMLLLIACANVANLLLARATGREREIAVRAALGAGAKRIVRQLLTESVMLGVLGGALGLGIAAGSIRTLVAIIPDTMPLVEELSLDPRVLAFLVAVSLTTGVLVGILPALRVASPNLRASLQEGGGGRAAGRRGGRARSALAVAQIALALVLTISSGLLVRSYLNLRGTELAYRSAGVLTFRTSLPEGAYPDDDDVRRFYPQVLERVRGLAGVESAGAADAFPSDDDYGAATYYDVEGAEVETHRRPIVNFRTITPGYLETMDLEVVEGRPFDESDRVGAPAVLLVTRRFADRLWPGESPLGRRLIFAAGPREIVGVVEDHRASGPDGELSEVAFFPAEQAPRRNLAFLIHASGDLSALVPLVREAVHRVDPAQPIYAVRTLEESLIADLGGARVMARVMGSTALIALLLALVGVYGVVAYSVAQRLHEMGLRMALGAEAGDVRRLVIGQGLRLGIFGLTIGLGLSLLVAKGLTTFLWGVGNFDPATFAGVTLLLLVAVISAAYVPARRATRVDPVIALRVE